MNDKAKQEAEAFKSTVEAKVEKLVNEFAEGQLNREQFQVIYDRYSSQIEIAEQAIKSGQMDEVYRTRNASSTIAMRDAYEAKATGLITYHYKSHTMLEKLGHFDFPMFLITPLIENFAAQVAQNKFVDNYVEKMGDGQWLLYVPGRFSTVVTLFVNEPSDMQIRKIEQLHRDFEKANRNLLEYDFIDANQLVYPFTVFVQKRRH